MTIASQLLYTFGYIPLLNLPALSHAVPVAKALLNGGARAVEITFRTADAAAGIKLIAKEVPELFIAAGTVRTKGQVDAAAEAGAKMIISPALNQDIIEYCTAKEIPVIPACATSSEVDFALRLGLDAVKLFPANVLGVQTAKAFSGPFPEMCYLITGGVTQDNLAEYLEVKNVAACAGTGLVTSDDYANSDWMGIEEKTKMLFSIVSKYRKSTGG